MSEEKEVKPKGRPKMHNMIAIRRCGVPDSGVEGGSRMIEVGEGFKCDKETAQKFMDEGIAKIVLD